MCVCACVSTVIERNHYNLRGTGKENKHQANMFYIIYPYIPGSQTK